MTRREEIVQATLELLATTPLEKVTTRQIAARLGLTQPALFRHFFTRDAIVLAAVEWTAQELEAAAAPVLALPLPPLGRAAQLALALGAHAQRFPGLPRLLFGDVATGDQLALRAALSKLVLRQRALVATLVREAQDRGEAPLTVDADRAAALFVSGMQGVLAHWLLAGATDTPDIAGFAALWQAGVTAGSPAAATPPAPRVDHIEVDAVAILAEGEDPLATVLAAADRLNPGGVVRVTAPFAPLPLQALLRGRGWTVDIAAGPPFVLTARRPA